MSPAGALSHCSASRHHPPPPGESPGVGVSGRGLGSQAPSRVCGARGLGAHSSGAGLKSWGGRVGSQPCLSRPQFPPAPAAGLTGTSSYLLPGALRPLQVLQTPSFHTEQRPRGPERCHLESQLRKWVGALGPVCRAALARCRGSGRKDPSGRALWSPGILTLRVLRFSNLMLDCVSPVCIGVSKRGAKPY